MNLLNIEKAAKLWEGKTLEGLRCSAVLEETGIAYDALRAEPGGRVCIVLCLTGHDQIEGMRTSLNFVDDGVMENWSSLSLAELVVRTSRVPGGFAFEAMKTGSGEWLALAMIAALPDSVKMMEDLFGLGS